jgi:hypothetical protein
MQTEGPACDVQKSRNDEPKDSECRGGPGLDGRHRCRRRSPLCAGTKESVSVAFIPPPGFFSASSITESVGVEDLRLRVERWAPIVGDEHERGIRRPNGDRSNKGNRLCSPDIK